MDFTRLRTYVMSGPNLPILLYLIWSFVSLIFSPEPFYSRLAFGQLLFGTVVYAVIVYQFRHRSQVKALLSTLTLVTVAVVLGSMASAGRSNLLDMGGWFHDRQLFGAFLAMLLPVLIGIGAGARSPWTRTSAQVVAVLTAGALLLTRGRSSLFGVIVGLIVFAILGAVYVWKLREMMRKKHTALLTPVLALIVLGIFLVFSGVGGGVFDRFSGSGNLMNDDSVRDRMVLWQTALKVVGQHPVVGCGIGAYAMAQAIANPAASQPLPVIRQLGPSLHESPHNTYLQVAAETGVVGLGLLLAIFALFFYYGARALPRLEKGLRKYTLIGCMASMAGMMVDAFSNPGFAYPEVATFVWIVLGVGMCAAGLGQEVPSPARAAREREADGPVLGVPRFLYRGFRTAALGCLVIWLGTVVWDMHSVGAAAAGLFDEVSKNRNPDIQNQGGGRGGRPIYCDFITRLDLDFLNDGIPPTQAFDINAGSIYSDRLAVFHIFALTDDKRFFADVTSEGDNIRFKLHGLQGKFSYSASSNDPRYFYTPSPKDKGKTGTIEVSYECRRPAEIFRTRFTLTILPSDAPINESAFSAGRQHDSGGQFSIFDPRFAPFLASLQPVIADRDEEKATEVAAP